MLCVNSQYLADFVDMNDVLPAGARLLMACTSYQISLSNHFHTVASSYICFHSYLRRLYVVGQDGIADNKVRNSRESKFNSDAVINNIVLRHPVREWYRTMAALLVRTSALHRQLRRTSTKIRICTIWLVQASVKITSSLKSFSNLSLGNRSTSNAAEEPRLLSTTWFTKIDADHLVKEEELPDYQADRSYPVQLGDIFQSRYQVIAKVVLVLLPRGWLGI